MPQSQRDLFKEFYKRIVTLGGEKGKKLGKEVYDLICQHILILYSYQEVMHNKNGPSARCEICIRVDYNERDYIIPGCLLISLKFPQDRKPLLMLAKNNENLQKLNHSVVGEDGIVNTDLFKNWNDNSSFVDAVRDLVDKLQDDPYAYEKHLNSDSNSNPNPNLDPNLNSNPNFNPNLKWEDIQLTSTVLGQGSYAVVYKGLYNNEEVAVKVWKRHLLQDDIVYFKREIEIQSKLNHPNCLKLYGVTTNPEGFLVKVLELADCSLAQLTTRRPPQSTPLTAQKKYELIKEIAEGIRYIHSCNIVHRDLKLDNILIKNGHAKIADFEHVHYMYQEALIIPFAGTPRVMAPELIMGQKVTKATDIYSFGCIIDEIMCEKLCYHDYCLQGISQAIFFRDIRRGLRPTIDSTIPKEVRYLIQDCFKEYSCRPSAEIVCKRIENWDWKSWNTKQQE